MAFPGLWAAAGETPCLFIGACKVSETLERLHFWGCVGGTAHVGSTLGWGHCGLTVLWGSAHCTASAIESQVFWGRSGCLHSPTAQAMGTQRPSEGTCLSQCVLCVGRISPLLADHTGWKCSGVRRGSLSQASSSTGSPKQWPGS